MARATPPVGRVPALAGVASGLPKKWYRAKEVAALCGLTEWQIRHGIRTGTIQATPHGQRSWLIPASEVDRLLLNDEAPAQRRGELRQEAIAPLQRLLEVLREEDALATRRRTAMGEERRYR